MANNNFWKKFDTLLAIVAKKDPHLVKNEDYRMVHPSDGKLQILVGSLSEKVVISVLFTLSLGFCIFVHVISTDYQSPVEVFVVWKFVVLITIYLLMLFYYCVQGYVVLDRINGKLTIKLWQYKLIGVKNVVINDTTSWHLDKVKAKSEHNRIYLKYKFSVRVNDDEHISILTVNRKSRGDDIKEAIETYLGVTLSPSRKKVRRW